MRPSLLQFLLRIASLGALLFGAHRVSAQTLQITPGASTYSAAGGVISYDVTITYPGTPTALGLRAIAPADWKYTATTGANAPSCLDAAGARQAVTGEGFGWFYFTAPASPAKFTIKFTYPAGQSGPKGVTFTALHLSATGAAVTITPSGPVSDLTPAATPPTITTQPAGATILAGAQATLTVVASGANPLSYQWSKGGKAIAGATQSSYAIAAATTADAGSYTVTVRNSAGSVTSSAAVLVIGEAARITVQPKDTTVSPGANAILSVTATSSSVRSYQWSFNSTPIPGATKSTYTITGATGAHTGYYQVTVTNVSDPVGVKSDSVLLQVAPPGTGASHQLVVTSGRGYTADTTVRVSNTLTFPATTTALGWTVLLPAGFSLASETSSASSKPTIGTTGRLDWAWDLGTATSPLTFTYTLNVPAGTTQTKTIGALAYARINNDTLPIVGTPDPLLVPEAGLPHSSDTNGDWKISLEELAATIVVFNTTHNNVRTGAYVYVTEQGVGYFVADPSGPAGIVDPQHVHSADTNADGTIELKELLQLIDLYNSRSGAERTGAYHWQADEPATDADRYGTGP